MKLWLFLLLAATSPAQELSPQEKQILMEQYYQKAFEHYKSGEYGRAVDAWTEILKLDRYQTSASELIEEARTKITAQNEEREKDVYGRVEKGEYQEAGLKVERLLGDDPTNPRYRNLRSRLSKISKHLPSARGEGRAMQLVRKALAAYLSPDQNFQFAYNALRYARDMDAGSRQIQGILKDFEEENRELARFDKLTPGMSFMEYKQIVALNQIYDGKYHLAVETCNEILALEPGDLVALKRLGSAYFALGVKDKARQSWEKALKLAPQDEQLQRFLAQTTGAEAPPKAKGPGTKPGPAP